MTADLCKTEEDAKAKAELISETSSSYPVYYFSSNTSGEKSYEEFFTDQENLDLDTFKQLGVVKNSERKSITTVEEMIATIKNILDNPNIDKQAIVKTIQSFMPNFEHIETGKNLDQKM
jgi:FlaA1/EpsC-like NDP-sugar epimerase